MIWFWAVRNIDRGTDRMYSKSKVLLGIFVCWFYHHVYCSSSLTLARWTVKFHCVELCLFLCRMVKSHSSRLDRSGLTCTVQCIELSHVFAVYVRKEKGRIKFDGRTKPSCDCAARRMEVVNAWALDLRICTWELVTLIENRDCVCRKMEAFDQYAVSRGSRPRTYYKHWWMCNEFWKGRIIGKIDIWAMQRHLPVRFCPVRPSGILTELYFGAKTLD